MRRMEREKTIRLAIILLAIVAITAIVAPNKTTSCQATTDQTCTTEILTEEYTDDAAATVLGIVVLSGLVVFEVATFLWVLKKEKQGYKFSI